MTTKHGKTCTLDRESFRDLKDASDHLGYVLHRLDPKHEVHKELSRISAKLLCSGYFSWLVANNIKAAPRRRVASSLAPRRTTKKK